jgi:gliding motility-associated-like protein
MMMQGRNIFLVFFSTNESLKKLRINTHRFKVCCKGLYILAILNFFAGGIARAQVTGTPPSCPPVITINPILPVKLQLDVNGSKIMDEAALATLGFAISCDGSKVTYSSDPKILTCADLSRGFIKFIASNLRPNPIAVTFSVPYDAVTDAAGNIYVADGYSCSVRKIATDGTVTTFVGGICGDADGKGTAARLKTVFGITIDAAGNLYVIDETQKVRKITPDGTATTLAGSGQNKSEDGTGTSASFNDPRGIAIDAAGNLYITQNDYLIRKVTPAGVVTTITPPSSVSKLNTPIGITVDAAGNLYVTDYSSAIKKIAPDGTITTIAGHPGSGSNDGTRAAASFNKPRGITMDSQGNLYVTDSQNNAIRKITPSGVVTTLTLTMTDTGKPATLNNPAGIKMDPSGNLIVVDTDNERILRVTPSGAVTRIAGVDSIVGNQNGDTSTPPTLGGESFEMVPIQVVSAAGTTSTTPGVKAVLGSLPANASVCVGGRVDFGVISLVPSNSIITNAQWQINGINVGDNSLFYHADNFQEGDKVTCTVTNTNSCTIPTPSDPIIVHIIPPPQITFNDDPTIELGGSVTLNPDIQGDIKALRWSPIEGLSNFTIKNPVAYPGVTTTYYLTVTNLTNCETTVGVTVKVVTPIKVPNVFTPNGDGINDLWVIKDLSNYPGCTVDVFNRYGQKLFHSQGYGKPWDGIFNGRKLAPGTYYYTITPQDGVKPLSGWVTIII